MHGSCRKVRFGGDTRKLVFRCDLWAIFKKSSGSYRSRSRPLSGLLSYGWTSRRRLLAKLAVAPPLSLKVVFGGLQEGLRPEGELPFKIMGQWSLSAVAIPLAVLEGVGRDESKRSASCSRPTSKLEQFEPLPILPHPGILWLAQRDIEVVGHAPREPSGGFQFLSLAELLLGNRCSVLGKKS